MTSPVTEVLHAKGCEVHTIASDATALEAVRRMNEAGIGALLVTEREHVVGIFTRRDVLRRVVDAGRDPARTQLLEVMTRPVWTVRPSTSIAEAMQLMTELRCRHLPVLEQGRAVGMVSVTDLTRWVVADQETAIQEMTAFLQGTYPR
jgi:CBS domain-containing protein